MEIARVRFGSQIVRAEVLPERAENGDWLMKSLERHARFDVGHTIQVPDRDIVERQIVAVAPPSVEPPRLAGWEGDLSTTG